MKQINIKKSIEELRKNSEKRNFEQMFELIINLKSINLKKSDTQFYEKFTLPNELGKKAKIVVFVDSMESDAKGFGFDVIPKEKIMINDKTLAKKFARKISRKYDFLMAEGPLMPLIGKKFGQILAPRKKMPIIITSKDMLKETQEKLNKTISIQLKTTPVIQFSVGSEKISDEKIIENINSGLEEVKTKLPKNKGNIKDILLKLTMSKTVKIQ